MFNSPISYPLYKLVSLPQCSYFIKYVGSFFDTRLFILGHLYYLLLHVTYILSLNNLHSSFSNMFFERKSILSVFMYFEHDSSLKVTIIMSLNPLSIVLCSFVFNCELIFRKSIRIGP